MSLERLRELDQQATPGPWTPTLWRSSSKYGTRDTYGVNGQYPDGTQPATNAVAEMLEYIPDQEERAPHNAALIAAMRNRWSALLDLWEAAQEHAKLFDKLGYPRLGADAGIDNTRARLDDALARLREEPGT